MKNGSRRFNRSSIYFPNYTGVRFFYAHKTLGVRFWFCRSRPRIKRTFAMSHTIRFPDLRFRPFYNSEIISFVVKIRFRTPTAHTHVTNWFQFLFSARFFSHETFVQRALPGRMLSKTYFTVF